MFAIFLGLTVFLLIAAVAMSLADGRGARIREVRERVGRALGEDAASQDSAEANAILMETQSDLSSVLSGAAQKVRLLRGIDLMLYRAGRPMTLGRLLGFVAAGILLGGLLGNAMGLPVLMLLGLLPLFFVWQKKKKRMKKFSDEFPQALALFSRALRAGHGLTAGFQMVADSLADPVATEFGLVAREISLGLDAGTAVANLQDRLDVPDLPIFTTAVLVQLETGGNLAEILDNLANMIRERMSFGGKVKALTGQSRMSANILAALPFGLAAMLNVFDPEYMAVFWEDPTGRVMAVVTIASVSFGFFLCRRLAQVEA